MLQHAGETAASAARDIAGAAERQHSGMDRITAAITQAGATSSSLAGAATDAQDVADRLRAAASRLEELTAHDVTGELPAAA
jgi:methyl-accepting chemotaxis protein